MKGKRPGRFDAATTVLAVVFLATLFVLAGGRDAILHAYNAPPVVLDGIFDEWAGAPNWPDTQIKDEPVDQKEIQFVEDVQLASFIENADGLWFKLDRWPKTGGIAQPVYYSVFFDLDMDHPTPHVPVPGEEWYERFENYGESHDWILICAFDPVAVGEEMCHSYLVRADLMIPPDPHAPVSQWPAFTEADIVTIGRGAWGQPYVRPDGGLSVEFGIPASFLSGVMGISPGQALQFFFGATLNNPMNHTFYPQQDFVPDDYDITREDIPTLGIAGTALLLLVAAGIAYGAVRKNEARSSSASGGAGVSRA